MTDVRLTATNPVDSSVVPVACNEKGELKLEEPLINSDEFVAKAGDTMTGNLHLGDGITLNPDGSAQLASGKIDVYETGKVIYGDKITLDGTNGSAEFALLTSYAGSVSTLGAKASSGLLVENNGSSGNISQIGLGYTFGSTYHPTAIAAITDSGSGSTRADLHFATRALTTDVAPETRMVITSDGNVEFAGDVNVGPYRRGTNNFEGLFLSKSGYIYSNRADGSYAFLTGFLNNAQTSRIGADGTAAFNGDVIVGSRGRQWMIVESNGLAHLVEQTRSNEISTADLVEAPKAPVEYPPLRDIPGELTMVEEQLQKVLEKLRMVPEAGWEVWDGSD